MGQEFFINNRKGFMKTNLLPKYDAIPNFNFAMTANMGYNANFSFPNEFSSNLAQGFRIRC